MSLYDNPTPEGLQMLAEQKKMAFILKHLQETFEKNGITSEEHKSLMKKYWDEEEIVRKDDNYKRHMVMLGLI